MTVTIIDSKRFKVACSNCSLSQLCLPAGLDQEEVECLDQLVSRRQIIKRGEHLFHEDQRFTHIYAVRSGSFKTYKLDGDSDERVINFYLPGEILGFHAIHDQRYAVSTIALETSSTCNIPFNDLFEVATHIPTLQKHLLDMMSQKLTPEVSIDLNSSADERVAKFLLGISARLKYRHLSASEFNLTMSRQDIGNHLGLATETVSRIFTRLQSEGIIKAKRREVQLVDFRKLQIMACGAHEL